MRNPQTNTHISAGSVNAETVAPKQPTHTEQVQDICFDLWSLGLPSFMADIMYLYQIMLEYQKDTDTIAISKDYHYQMIGRMFTAFEVLGKLNELFLLQNAEKGENSHA